MSDHVRPDTLEAVLERFGLSDKPEISAAGLALLYERWCENVSFDNAQKRVYISRGQTTGPLPGTDPQEFFDNYLAHGTGGTCWPTTSGMWALLRWIGFDAHRVTGNMITPVELDSPNHGANAVYVDGEQFLVDTSILNHVPIRLVDGQDATTDFPLNETKAEWFEGTWRIHWLPGHSRDPLVMQLDGPGLGESRDHDFVRFRSEASRSSSFFNDALYVRKSVPSGVRAIGRGKLTEIDAAGTVTSHELEAGEEKRVLVEVFGFSEQIVDAIPADNPDGLALG